MQNATFYRVNERGSAGVKFLIVIVFIAIVANAGYNYIPVAYQGQAMKSDMETAVLQGMAVPGSVNPVKNVKERITKAMEANQVPQDALVDVRQVGPGVNAHVSYTQPISILPFGIYKYNYVFDHTATPSGFLLKQAAN
jgi:hypothetical protein